MADAQRSQCHDLSRSIHRTMIFKADKPPRTNVRVRPKNLPGRQELEHTAAKRFPSVRNCFIITTYCRAYCSGTLLSLMSASVATSSTNTNTSDSQAQRCQSDVRRVMGILMERCVASLADVMWADDLIDSNSLATNVARSLFGFEWQTTTAACDDDTRPLFSSLCEATCGRLLCDMRDPCLLVHHFIHLCHALRYMHTYGVVHCDLKPENIFVRAIRSTPTAVSAVQLVFGDFDCSLVFDVKYDQSGMPLCVDWESKKVSSTPGTLG